jgi:hypothetical protein
MKGSLKRSVLVLSMTLLAFDSWPSSFAQGIYSIRQGEKRRQRRKSHSVKIVAAGSSVKARFYAQLGADGSFTLKG